VNDLTLKLVICGGGDKSLATSIQPEFWVDRAATAIRFYQAAFGVTVLLQVGEGEDLVAQLAVGDAVFWVAATDSQPPRFTPHAIGGATGRTLLVVDDPDVVFAQAVAAGAQALSPVSDEHSWRVGRIVDPFGHEWELGKHLTD
jgi:PhnB protein